jgi:hypothetical protein
MAILKPCKINTLTGLGNDKCYVFVDAISRTQVIV